MIEGLHLYEVVLLIAGALLFLVLLFALLLFILRKRSLKGLLAFFPVAIVMMGFPGISKISFENGKFVIERETQKLANNPNDSAARQQLADAVQKFEKQPISSAATYTLLARANAELGNANQALSYVDKALVVQPQMTTAIRLRESLTKARPKTVAPVVASTNLHRLVVTNLDTRRVPRKPNP